MKIPRPGYLRKLIDSRFNGMLKIIAISLLVLVSNIGGITIEAKTQAKKKAKVSGTSTNNFNLPYDFGFWTFVQPTDGDEYVGRPLTGNDLAVFGFKYLKSGKTYVLTGTSPVSYEEVASNTYNYKGIQVTLEAHYGFGVSIKFPNKRLLGEFLVYSMRGLPLESPSDNYYTLPGMASFSVEGLTIIFDFDP